MRLGLLLFLGLALIGIAGGPAHAGVNLVTNGNFATGDFTGWSPSDGSIVIDASFPPASDTYDAMFTGGGTLSQFVPTIAGQAYTLSFSLQDQAGSFLDTFTVDFGGFSTTINGSNAGPPYQAEVFAIPGSDISGTSTTLSFQGSDPSTLNWNLDDVSVVANAIPEAPAGTILTGAVLVLLSLHIRGRMKNG